MIDYSRDAMEPVQFSHFVSSFALLSSHEDATSNTTNATNGLFLILALSGTVADRRYRKRGGGGSTKMDKILLASGISLWIVLLVVLGIRGQVEVIGSRSYQFIVVLFALCNSIGGHFVAGTHYRSCPDCRRQSSESQIKQFCTVVVRSL
jgi:hypothetical protein